MNIAICDDEKIVRQQIKGLIEKQKADCNLELYGTGEELIAAGKHFDVVFLDIQMEGMNGIDTARAIREQNEETVLIFITGIKEYVFDAFDVAAFHYLLKPIEENKFMEVFDRAVNEAEKRKEKGQKQLFIKTRQRNITLEQKNILYIENRGRKAEIHTVDETIEIYAAMIELEKQLGGEFYRCHRGYLVNMAWSSGAGADQWRGYLPG